MLSLVIPTYNEKENLPIIVPAIFTEAKKQRIPLELIVVDDDSKDGTKEILDSLKKSIKNFELFTVKAKEDYPLLYLMGGKLQMEIF